MDASKLFVRLARQLMLSGYEMSKWNNLAQEEKENLINHRIENRLHFATKQIIKVFDAMSLVDEESARQEHDKELAALQEMLFRNLSTDFD